MRKMLLALLTVGSMAAISTAATTTSAEAWGGCGWRSHPSPWGCKLNTYYGGPYYRPGWAYAPYGYGWHRHYWRRRYW